VLEALNMSGHLARQSGIALAADCRSGSPIAVLADALRLRQVVINLLSNAIKYNRPGGRVSLKTRCHADRVVIEVTDTGLGMTREQVQHLYEPFNRLGRERGGIDGSGIGLALTRQLVRLMNGELDITSDVGVGTTAQVSLPLAKAGVPAPPIGADMPHAARRSPTDAHAPSGVVLYIEDNPVNVILVEQMLARWEGIRFEHAPDGASGIERARALRPDLVLLDMQLPDMTGDDVLVLLREDEATRRLPVVSLSASAMPDDVKRAREGGATDYWTKPLDLNDFLANVSRLLARSPARAIDAGAKAASPPALVRPSA
jgi:CheY-like chemotaxis protein/anti-sigma regulatory factor (Ser/Thr protein kinase)